MPYDPFCLNMNVGNHNETIQSQESKFSLTVKSTLETNDKVMNVLNILQQITEAVNAE